MSISLNALADPAQLNVYINTCVRACWCIVGMNQTNLKWRHSWWSGVEQRSGHCGRLTLDCRHCPMNSRDISALITTLTFVLERVVLSWRSHTTKLR